MVLKKLLQFFGVGKKKKKNSNKKGDDVPSIVNLVVLSVGGASHDHWMLLALFKTITMFPFLDNDDACVCS